MQIDLKNFIVGGYFLAKPADKAEWMTDFLPSKIISASSCIVDMLPEVWSVDSIKTPAQIKSLANHYNVSVEKLPEIINWVENNCESEIGLGNIFHSVSKAKEFASLFYDVSGLNVIGIGLSHEFVVDHFREEDEEYGVYRLLKQEKSLESGGEILGFEVLGTDYNSFHSWLCNGLEKGCKKEFGIIPNQNGLIETFEEARKCAEYANRDEVGAEDCLWLPWLILKYKI